MKKLSRLAQSFGLGRVVCLFLLAALVMLRIWDPSPLQSLRARTFDFYQELKPREAKLRPAVIVDIDEASLAAFGQWPWPRTLLADLVNKLTKHGSGGHRLRHHLCRTRPHVAGRRGAELPQSRRADARATREAAEQ